MRCFVTAVAVAALLLAGSGCSPDTEKPEAKSMPTKSSTPGPTATESPRPPGDQYNVDCIAVAANTARRISSGEKKGVGMVAGLTVALKSRDFKNVYLVAMQFKVSGASETQLGVWAIRKSLKLGEQGRIMAVDKSARQFTVWPDAGDSSVDISEADPSVGDVKACLLI